MGPQAPPRTPGYRPPKLASSRAQSAPSKSRPPPGAASGMSAGKQSLHQEEAAGRDEVRGGGFATSGPITPHFVPGLRIPAAPTPRKVVSARYATVQPKYMQPSSRDNSFRPSARAGGGSSSVAANVSASKNSKLKHRFQPTIEEIQRTLPKAPTNIACRMIKPT